MLLLAALVLMGMPGRAVPVCATAPLPPCAAFSSFRPVLRLWGGRGGGAWRGRAEEEEEERWAGGAGAYDPDEEYGANVGYGQQRRSTSPTSPHAVEEERRSLSTGRSSTSRVEDSASEQRYDPDPGDDLIPQSEAHSQEDWARRETSFMQRRREEEQYLKRQFGGDLSTLSKSGHKLREREWDRWDAVRRDSTLDPHSHVVTIAEKKRREEDARMLAAGGGLEKLAMPRPSVLDRERAAFVPDDLAVPSAERKKQAEDDKLIREFGGGLSEMPVPGPPALRPLAGDADLTKPAAISRAERRRKQEAEALAAFGGGLDSLVKRESELEKAKRLSKWGRGGRGTRHGLNSGKTPADDNVLL
jgi:hypothetical protein